MKSIIKSTTLFKIAQLFIGKNTPFLTSLLMRLVIYERMHNGKNSLIYRKESSKITILASNSEKYRGDLDILALSGKFRVLHIKQKWQRLILFKFYSDSFFGSSSVIRSKKGSDIYEMHKELSSYLIIVLDFLKKMVNIDCIIVPNYRYLDDYEWVIALKSLNIPSIMLYRECLINSGALYDFVTKRHKSTNMYVDHIIVHNERCKQSFLDSEYCSGNQITIAGALRMDSLVYRVNEKIQVKNKFKKRKVFTLFYFPYDAITFGNNNVLGDGVWKNRENFFLDIHNCIVSLAKENSDIDFIIKPKKTMMLGSSWLFYEDFMIKNKVHELPNYSINAEINVHDLIIDSDIICAFQSTTALEAAYAGKRVIMPLYHNFKNTKYYDIFIWRNCLDIFDVAIDNKTFKNIFKDSLKFPNVDKSIMKERKKMFNIFFGITSETSMKKYSHVIESIVMDCKVSK
jgi:hypothetical protein